MGHSANPTANIICSPLAALLQPHSTQHWPQLLLSALGAPAPAPHEPHRTTAPAAPHKPQCQVLEAGRDPWVPLLQPLLPPRAGHALDCAQDHVHPMMAAVLGLPCFNTIASCVSVSPAACCARPAGHTQIRDSVKRNLALPCMIGLLGALCMFWGDEWGTQQAPRAGRKVQGCLYSSHKVHPFWGASTTQPATEGTHLYLSPLCHPSDAHLVLNHPAVSFPKSVSSQSQRKEVVKSPGFALRSLLQPVHLVVEDRDRAVPPLGLWGLSACPLGCSRVSGGCLVVLSASQSPAASSPTLSPPGSPYKLHGVFCFAYSLEQTWWGAYKGGSSRICSGKPGAPWGAQQGTGHAGEHSSACKDWLHLCNQNGSLRCLGCP